MGLFGRGDDDEPDIEEIDPAEAEAAEGEVDPATSGADEVTDQDTDGAPAEEASPSDAQPDERDQDDIDVEEALKELSARMAMLSSNLEGVQESRGELEDKLGTVEERMSRLGSLAEAVSSEYNPFISENAPDEPSWTPELEAAEDGDPPALDPSSGDDEADTTTTDHPPEPTEEAAPPEPAPEEAPGPNGDGSSQPEPGSQTPEEAPTQIPETSPERLEPAQAEPLEDVDPTPMADATTDGTSPGDGLEENLLLLEWVGMMLDRVGRAGLMDLLDYYQNLGWLDTETKETATRVAIGVEAPDRVGEGHWRGDVELHRRSLVAIQRLQGNEVPAARIDELQLDLRRLFEG